MGSLRILIADDHDLIRRGLRALLESHPGSKICGEAQTGREAVARRSNAPLTTSKGWLPTWLARYYIKVFLHRNLPSQLELVSVSLPWMNRSEVNLHMRIAGRIMGCEMLSARAAQLYQPFIAPILLRGLYQTAMNMHRRQDNHDR